MIAYDKRLYYNRQAEPFYDPEWEAAEKSGEKHYWWMHLTDTAKVLKCYTDEMAALVMKRTGKRLVRLQ